MRILSLLCKQTDICLVFFNFNPNFFSIQKRLSGGNQNYEKRDFRSKIIESSLYRVMKCMILTWIHPTADDCFPKQHGEKW